MKRVGQSYLVDEAESFDIRISNTALLSYCSHLSDHFLFVSPQAEATPTVL